MEYRESFCQMSIKGYLSWFRNVSGKYVSAVLLKDKKDETIIKTLQVMLRFCCKSNKLWLCQVREHWKITCLRMWVNLEKCLCR